MLYQLEIGGQEFTVHVSEQKPGTLRVSVNGTPYDVVIRQDASAAPRAASVEPARPTEPGSQAPVAATGSAAPAVSGDGMVRAPIPGLILEVTVRVGEEVRPGQVVAVMEAMKMENNLTAHLSGKIMEVFVQKGSEVATGDSILRIG
jgi:biotin carboxyl carrier protein